MEEVYQDLIKFLPKENILKQEPMTKHTSIKIGGKTDLFIKIETVEQLKHTLRTIKEKNYPFYIIGNGSNLLVKDGGIRGAVLKIAIKEMKMEETEDSVIFEAGAGIPLIQLSQLALEKSATGLEFACGIPGTLGGAIAMNAGAYGCEMKDIVYSSDYMDDKGNIKTISNKEHEFEYRKSIFMQNEGIIISSILKLQKGTETEIKEKMEENKKARIEKQPIDMPSAGSTFKRGTDFITAKLIDECGLKGYQIGGAKVSEKHAGFLINIGNATAEDMLELITYVKEQVKEKFGKTIELEIKVIGENEK